MRKLGSIEKTEDFILAVAGGADINGTWRGSPLVEHYFTESMRHIVVYPAGHPKEHPDTDMEKLHVLIQAGADVSPLFSSANEYYEYGNLIRLIVRRMKLMNVVLGSRQAQSMTGQNPACRNDISSLHAVVDELAEKLGRQACVFLKNPVYYSIKKGSRKMSELNEKKYITFFSKRKKIELAVSSILYITMDRDKAEIHASGNRVYETWTSLSTLEELVGDEFVKVRRGCLASATAIHDITRKVNMINGDSLDYPIRKKKQLIDEFRSKKERIVGSMIKDDCPKTEEEYHRYFSSFDTLPIAFADIEMIFDERKHAVDWIFRYGNPALAKLEKLPLETLIGSTFGSLFSNMDSKWLRSYERTALYGEKLEMMDYSPEIDTYLKVICFPTFQGHCGCILMDLSEIEYIENSEDAEKARMRYFNKQKKSKDDSLTD